MHNFYDLASKLYCNAFYALAQPKTSLDRHEMPQVLLFLTHQNYQQLVYELIKSCALEHFNNKLSIWTQDFEQNPKQVHISKSVEVDRQPYYLMYWGHI
jgi:hypothetical protein